MPDPFSDKFKDTILATGNRAMIQIFNADKKHWCEGCNGPISQNHMYCMICGKQNPNFDLAQLKFEDEYDSIEEARQKECPEWHKPDFEIAEFKFCPYCGTDVFNQTLIALEG